MGKPSKRRRELLEKIEVGREYTIVEAIDLLKELSSSNFKESIDLAINLGVDPRQADQKCTRFNRIATWHRQRGSSRRIRSRRASGIGGKGWCRFSRIRRSGQKDSRR